MSEDISGLVKSAAALARPVVEGIDDTRLSDPTPCAEYEVKDLLNHLILVVTQFQALARHGQGDFSQTPDRVAAGDWRTEFAVESEKTVAAWSEPGALDGVSAGMGLPQATVGRMVLLDLTLHAWDLARATGQDYTPEPDVVSSLLLFLDDMAPMAREMGMFGEAVDVPADADPFTRVLAGSGRDPRWTGRPIE